MFTIYNKGNVKVEVIFQSAKPVTQVDENVVKAGNLAYVNKTKSIQMKWIPIESRRKFDFNMNEFKEYEGGNVKIMYTSHLIFTTEKDLQHKKGKGMEVTIDGGLQYCEMKNPNEGNEVSPSNHKSSICSIS